MLKEGSVVDKWTERDEILWEGQPSYVLTRSLSLSTYQQLFSSHPGNLWSKIGDEGVGQASSHAGQGCWPVDDGNKCKRYRGWVAQ